MSIHGLLLVHKPADITSHGVVKKVRQITRIQSIGHAGTLDPMATGLMVLLLGEATKLSDYILNGDKTYRLKVQFGLRTDTLDITGQVLNRAENLSLDPESVLKKAQSLQGEFEWAIPMFSAAKVKGVKLYETARAGGELGFVPKKMMKFWGLQNEVVEPDSFSAEVTCSKGSFIRSWASELGDQLGVGGALSALERTASHPFTISNAMSLDELINLGADAVQSPSWTRAFVPLENSVQDWPGYTVRGRDERLLLNGQISHDLERRMISEVRDATLLQKIIRIRLIGGESGRLLSIAEAIPNLGLKVRRVFKFEA